MDHQVKMLVERRRLLFPHHYAMQHSDRRSDETWIARLDPVAIAHQIVTLEAVGMKLISYRAKENKLTSSPL